MEDARALARLGRDEVIQFSKKTCGSASMAIQVYDAAVREFRADDVRQEALTARAELAAPLLME